MIYHIRKYCTPNLLSQLFLALFLQIVLAFLSANSQVNGDVKLVNGPTDYQGTVAIFYNGTWGSLCDDSWQYDDADVICRQIGYESAARVWYRARYGVAPGPILVDQIDCPRGVDHILKCRPEVAKWGIHDCSKREDAGVDCRRVVPVKPANMPIKLSCPDSPQGGSCKICPDKMHPKPGDCSVQPAVEGFVFASYGDKWHPVSANGFGLKEAKVVCGELGYPLALGLPQPEELWSNWDGLYLQNCEDEGSGEFGSTCNVDEVSENDEYRNELFTTLLKRLDCVGNERRLLDCYFSEFGPYAAEGVQVAAVRCGFKPHHACNTNTSATEVTLM